MVVIDLPQPSTAAKQSVYLSLSQPVRLALVKLCRI